MTIGTKELTEKQQLLENIYEKENNCRDISSENCQDYTKENLGVVKKGKPQWRN